ncbi:hypothetical protein LNAOJCKE_1311 [Methylorubrum aminovorans]|uniref:Uncharacterized protein n=1 Tax=Methylorubrum aminovorans TaxID=269069 RepID=A0ABQ4UA33_9HYPH|nr:hypothetical protein LNAOJCKE_1311 [Methylorubrum aminovorans]GMA76872.1 hypothetical protein GCM10025880_32890 [Methylorubrum aminovorans]
MVPVIRNASLGEGRDGAGQHHSGVLADPREVAPYPVRPIRSDPLRRRTACLGAWVASSLTVTFETRTDKGNVDRASVP